MNSRAAHLTNSEPAGRPKGRGGSGRSRAAKKLRARPRALALAPEDREDGAAGAGRRRLPPGRPRRQTRRQTLQSPRMRRPPSRRRPAMRARRAPGLLQGPPDLAPPGDRSQEDLLRACGRAGRRLQTRNPPRAGSGRLGQAWVQPGPARRRCRQEARGAEGAVRLRARQVTVAEGRAAAPSQRCSPAASGPCCAR